MSADDIGFETQELRSALFPVLRMDHLTAMGDPEGWAQQMVKESCQALGAVLPFTDPEREFLNRILDYGQVEPSLLTDGPELADHIFHHPGLLWKAQNVREFKGR